MALLVLKGGTDRPGFDCHVRYPCCLIASPLPKIVTVMSHHSPISAVGVGIEVVTEAESGKFPYLKK